jgi:hypothetical protein
MTCLGEKQLVAAELGEVTLNEAGTIEVHIEGCGRCARRRDELRLLLTDLARPCDVGSEAFVAQVMVRREATVRSSPRPGRRGVRLAGLAIAAVVLLGVGIGGRYRLWRGDQTAVDTWTARGRRHPARSEQPGSDQPTTEILAVRSGDLRTVDSQPLSPGDAFAVRFVNPGPAKYYLAAFALDAAGAVHWIYPGYVDAASDPPSILLPTAQEETLLPQIVEPEGPAQGPLQVVALVSRAPGSVKSVEAALREASPGHPVARALANAFTRPLIREWSSSWNAR